MTTRILVVEDDDRVAAVLLEIMRRGGYAAERAADGAAALAALTSAEPDLVLLDLGLPDVDGLQVCRRIRAVSDVPVIAVTARAAERDRVEGLRTGADDYVVKPFGRAELLARIEAVLRRSTMRAARPATAVGDIDLDQDGQLVTVKGVRVELTRKEFELLALLVRRRGTVVAREDILRAVWQTGWSGAAHTIETHVGSLRHKIGRDAIRTVRGVGYIVDA